MIGWKNVLLWKLREPDKEVCPENTEKEAVDKDVNGMHIKLSDVLEDGEWRKMIGGNWSDRSSDNGGESWMWNMNCTILVLAHPG